MLKETFLYRIHSSVTGGRLHYDTENPSRTEIGEALKKSKTIACCWIIRCVPERTSYMVSKAMQDAGYRIIPVIQQLMKYLEKGSSFTGGY